LNKETTVKTYFKGITKIDLTDWENTYLPAFGQNVLKDRPELVYGSTAHFNEIFDAVAEDIDGDLYHVVATHRSNGKAEIKVRPFRRAPHEENGV